MGNFRLLLHKSVSISEDLKKTNKSIQTSLIVLSHKIRTISVLGM